MKKKMSEVPSIDLQNPQGCFAFAPFGLIDNIATAFPN